MSFFSGNVEGSGQQNISLIPFFNINLRPGL